MEDGSGGGGGGRERRLPLLVGAATALAVGGWAVWRFLRWRQQRALLSLLGTNPLFDDPSVPDDGSGVLALLTEAAGPDPVPDWSPEEVEREQQRSMNVDPAEAVPILARLYLCFRATTRELDFGLLASCLTHLAANLVQMGDYLTACAVCEYTLRNHALEAAAPEVQMPLVQAYAGACVGLRRFAFAVQMVERHVEMFRVKDAAAAPRSLAVGLLSVVAAELLSSWAGQFEYYRENPQYGLLLERAEGYFRSAAWHAEGFPHDLEMQSMLHGTLVSHLSLCGALCDVLDAYDRFIAAEEARSCTADRIASLLLDQAAIGLGDLGNAQSLARSDRAIQRVLAMYRTLPGEEWIEREAYVRAVHLARVLRKQGRGAEADRALNEYLELARRNKGLSHPLIQTDEMAMSALVVKASVVTATVRCIRDVVSKQPRLSDGAVLTLEVRDAGGSGVARQSVVLHSNVLCNPDRAKRVVEFSVPVHFVPRACVVTSVVNGREEARLDQPIVVHDLK